jgi:uncharacterized protein YdhG (YjbR/CyaY superfamily)
MEQTSIKDIDTYIGRFPLRTQELLRKVRETIKHAAANAEEAISYQMPTFKLNGNLVHFAGYKHHIGFYPAPSGIEKFKQELAGYKGAKGSVQFPLDAKIPYGLIKRIVQFRVQENVEKVRTKTKESESKESLLSGLAAPAKRALENKGIKSLKQLSKFSEADILHLHGIGPGSIPKLRGALEKEGLSFADL